MISTLKPHGIMFHHFHDYRKHLQGQGSISADEFVRILTLCKKRYHVLSAGDWYERALIDKLSKEDVCITLDDSLRCQFDIALPVLKEFGIKAFWFIYTSPLDNVIEKLELYRYYRTKAFKSIKNFYDVFNHAVSKFEFSKIVQMRLKDFQPDSYLKEYAFYTREDRIFRYMRDGVLGKRNYEKIMDSMISSSNIDLDRIVDRLWINKDDVQTLYNKGHMIGLHSHTHPTALNQLSRRGQESEYHKNYSKIKSIIEKEAVSMSHPCNSYNKETLEILRGLKIMIGFRSDMTLKKHSKLEFPRQDHAYLLKDI